MEQRLRMAHLAIVGSSHVNGVSALHSGILRERLFADFAEDVAAKKFGNETNGITPRRWLRKCNEPLSALITAHIGESWVTDLPQLGRLEPLADDPGVRAGFRAAKRANKERLAADLEKSLGARLPVDAIFDVQVKRIHEYKRQLLPILHAVRLHQLAAAGHERVPRVVLIAGKAAPGYDMAKRIIRLACDVGATLAADVRSARPGAPPLRAELLRLPGRAHHPRRRPLRAGLDGGHRGVGHREHHEALAQRRPHDRHSRRRQHRDPRGRRRRELLRLRDDRRRRRGAEAGPATTRAPSTARTRRSPLEVLDAIASGAYSGGDPGRHRPIVDALLSTDPYRVLADYPAYAAA